MTSRKRVNVAGSTSSPESSGNVFEDTVKRVIEAKQATVPTKMDTDAPSTADPDTQTSAALRGAISGAGYLFSLQLFSKIITFSANQILLRHVAPQIFGLATVQLELLVSTLLFFSREPLRLVSLRVTPPALDEQDHPGLDQNKRSKLQKALDRNQLQRVVNLAWIAPLVGLPFATFLALYYTHYLPEADVPEYSKSVWMYAFGAWLDSLAEPFYAAAFYSMNLSLRALAEGAALIVSCLTACLLTVFHGKQYGLMAFGLARIGFGAVYLLSFVIYFIYRGFVSKDHRFSLAAVKPRHFQVIVKEKVISQFFDWELLAVAWSFLKQSILKHFLTEGDKFILSAWFTAFDKGVYALAFNYGSIIARIVFLPLEDAARIIFSKLGSSNISLSRELLTTTVKFNIILGLFLLAIGTHYTDTFLHIFVGSKWTESPASSSSEPRWSWSFGSSPAAHALAAYCLYIPILGINGITEAFVTSMATPHELQLQSRWLIVCSLLFSAACYLMFDLGAAGLVLANAINLSARIAWSSSFIQTFFQARTPSPSRSVTVEHIVVSRQSSWASLFPPRAVINGFVLSWLVTRWSKNTWVGSSPDMQSMLIHMLVGAGCATFCIMLICSRDYKFLVKLWRLRKGQFSAP